MQYRNGKKIVFLFSKEGDLGITKNYRGITLCAQADKVYNDLFLNLSNLKLRKFLEIVFGEIDPQLARFWQSIVSLKEYAQKTRGSTIVPLFIQGIWFHTRKKYNYQMEQAVGRIGHYVRENKTEFIF